MSAMPIALLVTTVATGAVGVAVLRTLMVLRRQVAALHTEIAKSNATATRGFVPAARPAADVDEIRAAVAEALAEERERELAEARAFWAAQEARDATDAPSSLLGLPDSELFLPRQTDFVGLEPLEPVAEPGADTDEFAGSSSSGETRRSWPRPAAATPPTRTSFPWRRPWSTTTSERWPRWRSWPPPPPS